ncbi:hypothetical protein C5167_034069 [Papaver somniferum]|uniref:Transposase MuDR plant domain-containing protein n=1 Tax=Papaver somniferum TaxID=3469 RepID=A0A4Y7KFU6_PAPSO|nr:hypothetical protein C5167_034069 [Papaver somniferum]
MAVVSCISVVRYFSDFITTRVDVEITLDEFKVKVCKQWQQFTPLGICFFFREGGKDLPVDCDYLLQALTTLAHSKKKTSFDIFLQNVTHVASSSSSRAVSSICNGSSMSSRNNCSVGMYLEDMSKSAKPLLSDGWPKVLGEIGHLFVEGVKQVRIAYTKYRLRTGFNMVLTHNECSRFTAKCGVKECGWKFLAASIDERNEIFMVIAYNPEHTYGASGRNLNQKYSISFTSSFIFRATMELLWSIIMPIVVGKGL